MRDVIVVGAMIAAVLILIRVIIGTPLVARVRESFASGSVTARPINSSTSCPLDSQLYMYNGVAYCCNGNIDTSADRPADTCKPTPGRDAESSFCTLGSRKHGVPNCLEFHEARMQAKARTICPSAMPTYVKGADQTGRCCADAGNPELTACQGAISCEAIAEPNIYKNPGSCQFKRAQEEVVCPQGFGTFTSPGQGALASLTLLGCTNNSQNCFADSTLARLRELGYNTAGMPSCSSI